MCLESCSNPDLGCDPHYYKRVRNRASKEAHRARVKARKQVQTAQGVAGSNLKPGDLVMTQAELDAFAVATDPAGGSYS